MKVGWRRRSIKAPYNNLHTSISPPPGYRPTHPTGLPLERPQEGGGGPEGGINKGKKLSTRHHLFLSGKVTRTTTTEPAPDEIRALGKLEAESLLGAAAAA